MSAFVNSLLLKQGVKWGRIISVHRRQIKSLGIKMPPKKNLKRKTEDIPSSSKVKDEVNGKEEKVEKKDNEEFTHWLIKSEPETRMEKGVDVRFSFDDLKAEPNETAFWDGVRNYQARNNMRAMREGQRAFFYHSNTKPPGIVGIVDIVKEAAVDPTQFDPKDPHYDPKSSKDNPKWDGVEVKYVRKLNRYIPLQELKDLHLKHKPNKGPLANLALFTRARLSVCPISQEEFDFILSIEGKSKE